MTSTHAAAWLALAERLGKESCGDCISTPCPYCAKQTKFALKVIDATLRAMAAQQEPRAGCINCGEANDGGYETEEVGAFCSSCWASLGEYFKANPIEEQAAKPTDGQQDWQPIETAPIGVTDVLLCWHDEVAAPMFAVGHNLGNGRRWQTTHEWLHNDQAWPTHWMPLPAPPATQATPPQEGCSAPWQRRGSCRKNLDVPMADWCDWCKRNG